MKLLVTGGAGFIGSNFVRYWMSQYPKDQIKVLDKLTYAGHLENLEDVVGKENLHLVIGDICNPVIVEEAMQGIDVVVHFAAESHVDRSVLGPQVFTLTNVVGTQVLLDAALKNQVRLFHHVSTDEVYGSLKLGDRKRFDEESRYAPRTPYAASKASADHLVRAYYETYGLPITLTNTSNNYGPWHDPEKLIPRFITNLLIGEKVPLMGKGANVRDWIHVVDHCRAIGMVIHGALNDEGIMGETFCVGGNSERTNLQVTKEILGLFGKDESLIQYVPDRLGHDERYAIDSSKIKRAFGWEPTYSFEDGLRETIEWYKQNENWWRPLKEGRPNIDPEVQRRLVERR